MSFLLKDFKHLITFQMRIINLEIGHEIVVQFTEKFSL